MTTKFAGLTPKFKVGDPMPNKVKEWFPFDQEVWSCLRGTYHIDGLKLVVQRKGLSMTELYKQMVKGVYTKRVSGGNVGRDLRDLRQMEMHGDVQDEEQHLVEQQPQVGEQEQRKVEEEEERRRRQAAERRESEVKSLQDCKRG